MIHGVGGIGGAGGISSSNPPSPEVNTFYNDCVNYLNHLADLESDPTNTDFQEQVNTAQQALFTGQPFNGSMTAMMDKYGYKQMFGSGVGQTFYNDFTTGLPGFSLWPGGPVNFQQLGEALQNNPNFLPKLKQELSSFYIYFNANPPTPISKK